MPPGCCGFRRPARAAQLSAARDAAGRLRAGMAHTAAGPEFAVALRPHPRGLTTAAAPLNSAQLEGHAVRGWLGQPGVAGIAVAGVPDRAELDFNRAALAAADYPCAYDPDLGAAGQPPGASAAGFLFPLGRVLEAQGARLAVRLPPGGPPAWLPPADFRIETVGAGPCAVPGPDAMFRRRALAGPAVQVQLADETLALSGAPFEAWLRETVAWGFVPGLDRVPAELPAEARAALRRLAPVAARHAVAGWQPVADATADGPGVAVEAFGPEADGVRHFTLRRASGAAEGGANRATLRVDGVAPGATWVEPLRGAVREAAPDAEGRAAVGARLAPGEVAVFSLVPAEALAAEQERQAARAARGNDEAAAACAANLASLVAERDAGVAAGLEAPEVRVEGGPIAVALRLANDGADPAVVSEVRWSFEGDPVAETAAPRILGPGEHASLEAALRPPAQGGGWLRVTWRVQRGEGEWTGERRARLAAQPEFTLRPAADSLTSWNSETSAPLVVANAGDRDLDAVLAWSGAVERGRRPVRIPAGGEIELAIPVAGRPGREGAMRLRLLEGVRVRAQTEVPVRFLAARESALGDSRARLLADSAQPGACACAAADGRIPTQPSAGALPEGAWFSDETRRPRWIRAVLGEPATLGEAVFHWAPDAQGFVVPRRAALVGFTPEGDEVPLGEIAQDPGESVTAVRFAPVRLTAVELRQPPGGGPAARPYLLALSEWELR